MTSASYTPSFSFLVKASSADSITIKSDLPAPGPTDAQHDFFVVGVIDGIKHVKLEQNRYSKQCFFFFFFFFISKFISRRAVAHRVNFFCNYIHGTPTNRGLESRKEKEKER